MKPEAVVVFMKPSFFRKFKFLSCMKYTVIEAMPATVVFFELELTHLEKCVELHISVQKRQQNKNIPVGLVKN